MTNILQKPYTNKEYADFAVMANTNGQRVEIDDSAAYALYNYEQLQNGEIVDVSQSPDYLAKQLDSAKEQKIEQNKTAYSTALSGGLIYNNIKFDCDDRALLRISAQAMDNQMTNRTDYITWFDYDYTPQTLTVNEFEGLCDAVKNFTTKVESQNCNVNIAINNAKTLEELSQINIDYSSL